MELHTLSFFHNYLKEPFQEEFVFDSLKIVATSDHILASHCSHDSLTNVPANADCQVTFFFFRSYLSDIFLLRWCTSNISLTTRIIIFHNFRIKFAQSDSTIRSKRKQGFFLFLAAEWWTEQATLSSSQTDIYFTYLLSC